MVTGQAKDWTRLSSDLNTGHIWCSLFLPVTLLQEPCPVLGTVYCDRQTLWPSYLELLFSHPGRRTTVPVLSLWSQVLVLSASQTVSISVPVGHTHRFGTSHLLELSSMSCRSSGSGIKSRHFLDT